MDNINFNISAGQLIHIKGVSGSGKSTLLRLLTGAYKNFNGNILIEGQSINNYKLESIRNNTGILFNSQDIFTGSLFDNITMGNPSITLIQVKDFVERFGLTEFVQSDKQGIYMILDPSGRRLSKEVRQKILLVRALLGRHRLLLLEEPFEYLDESTAEILMKWLKKLNNTTILIASNNEKLTLECDAVLTL